MKEMSVPETQVYSKHITRPSAQEDFPEFSHHENFQTHIYKYTK